MPLQKLVGNIYSVMVEIILWIVPIAGAIAGYILAENYFHDDRLILWIALGIVSGLFVDVLLFGPVIIMFNIRASLKNIENK